MVWMIVAITVVALLLLVIAKKKGAPDTVPGYPNRLENSSLAPSLSLFSLFYGSGHGGEATGNSSAK